MNGTGNPINFRPIEGTRLFRSSQPEDVSTSSIFKEAGIKTIIDLRDLSEVKRSQACADYRKCKVHATGEVPELKPMAKQKETQRVTPDGLYAGVHAILSLINHRRLVKEAGAKRILIVLAYIIDQIFGTRYATKLTIRWIMNKHGDQSLLWLYKHTVDTSGHSFNAALRLLAEPSHVPAVVICSLGKDRTGMTCMMVGHICGQSEEQLINEYAKSEERYNKHQDHFLMKGADKLKLHESYKWARRDTMAGLIEHIKTKYGSLDEYLDSIGFGAELREKLRQNVMAKQ